MAKKPTKRVLIETAQKYAGCVTDVAKACQVSRQTVYKWMEKDPAFKSEMANGSEILVDLALKGLRHHLKEKSEKTVHYTLDRLARDKGFGKLITLKDKSKFEDQFNEMTNEELEDLLVTTTQRIKNAT